MKKQKETKIKTVPKKPPKDLSSYQSAFLNDVFTPVVGDTVYFIRDHRRDKQESVCTVFKIVGECVYLWDETLEQIFMFKTTGPFPNLKTTIKKKKVNSPESVSFNESVQDDITMNEETESGSPIVNVGAETNEFPLLVESTPS